MKILIIRFSSIGDIVLTTPIIRCARNVFPDAEIHFATKSNFASLLSENPYLDKLQLLGDSFVDFLQKMRSEKYDLVIDLHKNTRSFLIREAIGAKVVSFDKLNYEKWLSTQFKMNKLPDKHLVDRYFDGVKCVGVKDDGRGLDFFISAPVILLTNMIYCKLPIRLSTGISICYRTRIFSWTVVSIQPASDKSQATSHPPG